MGPSLPVHILFTPTLSDALLFMHAIGAVGTAVEKTTLKIVHVYSTGPEV